MSGNGVGDVESDLEFEYGLRLGHGTVYHVGVELMILGMQSGYGCGPWTVCVLRFKCWSGIGVCFGSRGGIDLGSVSHLNMYGGFGLGFCCL